MKKVLIVSEVFWPEDFIINDLAREWHNQGHEVHVLSQYPSYPGSYVFEGYTNKGCVVEDWDGIKIHRFPFIEGYRDSKLKKFSNYIKFVLEGRKLACSIADSFDAIFVSQTGPLSVAMPAIAAGKKYGIPVSIWTADIWPDVLWSYGVPQCRLTRFIADRFITKIYAGCAHIFVTSRKFSETISRYTDKEIIYAPNWLRPIDEKKSSLRLNQSEFNFTFTGNVSLYQNLENTVTGFGKAGLSNGVLNIIGDGSYLAQLKEIVMDKGIRNFRFFGRIPYDQIADVLSQSQVLVLPLVNNEGVMKTEPFKLQSYLDAGRPILGILGGSGKEIIEENSLGLTALPDDIDDIARAFRESFDFYENNFSEVKDCSRQLLQTRYRKETILKTLGSTL